MKYLLTKIEYFFRILSGSDMKHIKIGFLLLIIAFSVSCTSIGSNVVRHTYIAETLVPAEGFDLNQVSEINILIGEDIYAALLSSDLSDDTSNDIADKPSFFSKEETARRKALRQKKYESFIFALQLKKYIETFYHNRGLQKPKVSILTKPKSFFGYELTIDIRTLDIQIDDKWEDVTRDVEMTDDKIVVYHNNIDYERTVRVTIDAQIERYDEAKFSCELTDDVTYTIAASDCIRRTYKDEQQRQKLENLFMPKTETFAEFNIRQIEPKMLYSGAIDKIFREMFGTRLQAIAKDVVYFRYGKGEKFSHAQACLAHGCLSEAEMVWQEIYDDVTNPSFARGVAAYNLGMCKTIVRDYEAAAMYFSISEDLRADGLQDLERF